MDLTIPEDKKALIVKENKLVAEKLEVVAQFEEKVRKVEEFCNSLKEFDTSLKTIDKWMKAATQELNDIRNCSSSMTPEDRVARTMDLQEDIAAKVAIIEADTAKELELLPQGDTVPKDAQNFKDELQRITRYCSDLQTKVKSECNAFSEDVKFWAEYRTGIREFTPWLIDAEKVSTDGLSKPTNLEEASALAEKVHSFEKSCTDHLKVLTAANLAAQNMTTHKEADDEVAILTGRYQKVKDIADTWVSKADTLVREWALLDSTVSELNDWVAKDKTMDGENQFSLEKMESTLGELKNIYREKEKLVENL